MGLIAARIRALEKQNGRHDRPRRLDEMSDAELEHLINGGLGELTDAQLEAIIAQGPVPIAELRQLSDEQLQRIVELDAEIAARLEDFERRGWLVLVDGRFIVGQAMPQHQQAQCQEIVDMLNGGQSEPTEPTARP